MSSRENSTQVPMAFQKATKYLILNTSLLTLNQPRKAFIGNCDLEANLGVFGHFQKFSQQLGVQNCVYLVNGYEFLDAVFTIVFFMLFWIRMSKDLSDKIYSNTVWSTQCPIYKGNGILIHGRFQGVGKKFFCGICQGTSQETTQAI